MSLINRDEFDLHPQEFQLSHKTLPSDAKKYWKQRYSLFSRFDEGIYMTYELWYSVTPEVIALFIAKFVKSCNPNLKTICDVFCGGGGNTIQFARKFDKVIGIDINEKNLYCTEKNCEVYGVKDRIELYLGSWIDLIDTEYYEHLQDEVDMIFASPPWGGPAYKNQDVFDLNYLEPLPIRKLLDSFFRITKNVCLFLPRNSDVGQLAQITRELLGEDARCRIIYTFNGGYIKGMFAFWGDSFMPAEVEQNQEQQKTTEATMYDEDFYYEQPENQEATEAYSQMIKSYYTGFNTNSRNNYGNQDYSNNYQTGNDQNFQPQNFDQYQSNQDQEGYYQQGGNKIDNYQSGDYDDAEGYDENHQGSYDNAAYEEGSYPEGYGEVDYHAYDDQPDDAYPEYDEATYENGYEGEYHEEQADYEEGEYYEGDYEDGKGEGEGYDYDEYDEDKDAFYEDDENDGSDESELIESEFADALETPEDTAIDIEAIVKSERIKKRKGIW